MLSMSSGCADDGMIDTTWSAKRFTTTELSLTMASDRHPSFSDMSASVSSATTDATFAYHSPAQQSRSS